MLMLENRLIPMEQAVALVQDQHTLALGGMTLYRRPVAFVYHLLRRQPRPKDLTLLCFTAGYESDLLVGAGCVRKVRSCYFGLESFGLAPMFTQHAQKGQITVIEETESSIINGIRASLSGVSHLPSTSWVGTDLPKLREDIKSIHDPYTDEELVAFPAIDCDVAVLHGLAADQQGNVQINNNLAIDLELIYLAKTVIVTVEKIVDALEPDANSVLIPYPGADYIVHAPGGAYPTSCYPVYTIGGSELMRYVERCNEGQFVAYLDEVLRKL